MRSLFMGLYAEGPSDQRFLPPLITRMVRRIMAERKRYEVDVVTPENIDVPRHDTSGEAERILAAAKRAVGSDLLFVHLDAGAPDREAAIQLRFQPGLAYVQKTEGDLCRRLVPIVPIREIEAWMIADLDTLVRLINPGITSEQVRNDLKLHQRPHEVEADHEPKETLKGIIRAALSHRRRGRRTVDQTELQAQLGEEVRLDVLNRVPAFVQFIADLTGALIDMGVVKADDEM